MVNGRTEAEDMERQYQLATTGQTAAGDPLRTLFEHTTHDEGSVRGDGTVGKRLVERLSITQAMLDDNEKLRAEVAQLREAIRRLAEQDAAMSVQGGSVTVTMDATLTDAEREAVEWCVEMATVHASDCDDELATLRNLLERLHT